MPLEDAHSELQTDSLKPVLLSRDTLSTRVAALNKRYRHHSATEVLRHALKDPDAGQLAMVSSFGAESVILLHLVAMIDQSVPVLFIDTQMLFQETLDYQVDVSRQLGLTNVRVIRASDEELQKNDPYTALHLSDPDRCCNLRKTVPLANALKSFDGWITGRKRFQASSRSELEFFEADEVTGQIKVNPLAHWTQDNLSTYLDENRLPRHPLVAKGYPSIGCAPCTSQVAPGEDPRSGRWRDSNKVECGIHFANGEAVRNGDKS